MLPEGWVRTKIKKIAKVSSGTTPLRAKGDLYYSDSGTPWVKTMDLTNGPIKETDERITDLAIQESSCNPYPPGTVLVAMYGGFRQIGRTGILTKKAAINQAISAIQLNSKKAIPEYVLLYLNSHVFMWRRFAASSRKDPNITRADVCDFPVTLPSISEQQAIAEIIKSWSDAIEALKNKILEKQKQKKALIQSLLTGKHRFPEFEGQKWEKVKADKIFKSYSKKNNPDEPLLAVMQDIGVVPRDMLDRRVAMPEGSTEGYKLIESGDFVISLRSFQGGLEYSRYKGIVSPAYTILKSIRPIDDDFFRHYFKSYEFIGRLAIAVIGIRDGKQISYDDFSFMDLPCPSIEEQNKIAAVLNAADKEIALLTQKLEAYQEQKKGLMQQLLTGKKRVKVGNQEAA